MKQKIMVVGVIALLVLLAVCGYLSYTDDNSSNSETIDNYIESLPIDNYNENLSDIVGVWTVKYESGKTAFMRCFNESGEYYHIDFHYETFGDGNICELKCYIGDYYENDNNEIVICIFDEEIICSYSVEGNALILNNDVTKNRAVKLYKRDYSTSLCDSLVGSWKTYGGMSLRHEIENLITISRNFDFYYDGSFKLDGSQGNYQIIYDGEGVELYFEDHKEIYNIYYIADGLVLLDNYISGSILLERND